MDDEAEKVIYRNRRIIAEIERVNAEIDKHETRQKSRRNENATTKSPESNYFEYNEKLLLIEQMQKENERLRKEHASLKLTLLKQQREREELQSAVYTSQAKRLAMLSPSYT